MAHIFLSYARPEVAKAKRAIAALTAAGYDVWWDDQLPTHRTFYEVLEERLREAQAVVVLWSKLAAQSQWVRAEADMGRTLGKLVQASLEAELPPMPFNQIQCAQLKGWNGNVDDPEWVKVLDGVRAVAGSSAGQGQPSHAPLAPARQWLKPVVAAVVSVAVLIGVSLYWTMARKPAVETVNAVTEAESSQLPAAPRIAVLPFEPIGADPQVATFATALADTLAGALSENMVQTIPVSRTAEFTGSGRAAALQAIGANLALSGSVRSAGGRLSVRAYIEDLASNFTVWSSQFEQPTNQETLLLAEVGAGVTDMAYVIADALEQPGLRLDPQTLSLFLTAMEQMGRAKGKRTMALAEQVVARSPKLAAGHGMLALLLAEDPGPPEQAPARRERARREANEAIRLFAATGAAYDALYSLARSEAPTDLALAEAQLIDGLRAAPNFPFLSMRRCDFLVSVGRIADAIGYCEQAVALRPLSPPPLFHLVNTMWFDGQTERASAALEEAAAKHPNQWWVNFLRFDILSNTGRAHEAAAMLADPRQRPTTIAPEAVGAVQACLEAVVTGSPVDIDAAFQQLSTAAAAGRLRFGAEIAIASNLGKTDEAFDWLDRMAPSAPVNWQILFHPALNPLRRDPRFMTIAAHSGLISYWRKTDAWPDFCADPTLPYDCKVEAAKVRLGS